MNKWKIALVEKKLRPSTVDDYLKSNYPVHPRHPINLDADNSQNQDGQDEEINKMITQLHSYIQFISSIP